MNLTEHTTHTRSIRATLDDTEFRRILAEHVAEKAGVHLGGPGVTWQVTMNHSNYGGLGSPSEQRALVEITVDLKPQPCSESS